MKTFHVLLRGSLLAGALFLSAPRLLAQSPDSVVTRAALPPTELKSGTTATLLSAMVPGLGHLYAEDGRTGVVLITLFAAAIALHAGGENATSSPIALLFVGGPWCYGVIDAHNAAARYNLAHTNNASAFQADPLVTASANGRVRLGIAINLGH